MSRRIVVRPQASRDLDEQADYLAAHHNLQTALRFYRAAEETFQLIATQPEMGKLTEYSNPVLANTRMFPMKQFEKHLVFYRPLVGGIEVLRVIHGARDIENIFDQ